MFMPSYREQHIPDCAVKAYMLFRLYAILINSVLEDRLNLTKGQHKLMHLHKALHLQEGVVSNVVYSS